MDKTFWECYYKQHLAPRDPSTFAKFYGEQCKVGEKLLELGCGNGRDCIYFASLGLDVTAVEQAAEAVKEIMEKQIPQLKVTADDFVTSDVMSAATYQHVYSRFTIHAIVEAEEDLLLKSIYNTLIPGGKLAVEVRSTKDPLYGQGEEIAPDTYVCDGHARRFIHAERFLNKLKALGFTIDFHVEQAGLAIYKDSDPVVLRVVAKK